MPSADFRSEEEMLRLVHDRAGQLVRGRVRRRRAALGVAGVSVLVVGALALSSRPDGADHSKVRTSGGGVTTTTERGPLTEAEGWAPMADAPLSGRSTAISAWTGTEVLIWRGAGAFTDACDMIDGVQLCGDSMRNDGAAYNPSTDTWRPLPDSPMAHEAGSDAAMLNGVWTGSELVVWGGTRGEGAAYDPEADAWREIAGAPLDPRQSFSMTWTGTEVVVFGGIDLAFDGSPFDDGAAYDPVEDRWRPIADAGTGRFDHTGLAVGGNLLVVGGIDPETGGITSTQAYDLAADSWQSRASSPLDDITSAVWTGTQVLAFGSELTDAGRLPAAAAYDPAADTWTTLPDPPLPPNLVQPAVTWTGREMVVLGAPFVDPQAPGHPQGAAFDPGAGTWRELPDPELSVRSGQTAVWTGDQLVVWGGAAFTGFASTPYGNGARYRPGPGR